MLLFRRREQFHPDRDVEMVVKRGVCDIHFLFIHAIDQHILFRINEIKRGFLAGRERGHDEQHKHDFNARFHNSFILKLQGAFNAKNEPNSGES